MRKERSRGRWVNRGKSCVFLDPLLDASVVLSWWGDLQSARSALMSTRAPGSLAVVVATEDTIVKAEAEEAFSQMLGEGEKEEEGDWRKITFPLHLLSLNGDFDCTFVPWVHCIMCCPQLQEPTIRTREEASSPERRKPGSTSDCHTGVLKPYCRRML